MNLKGQLIFFCSILYMTVLIFPGKVYAQELSSDDLFSQARISAFEQKNYGKAIALCKQALVKSPDYTDIHVFLGRLYTWSNKLDSAQMAFSSALKKDAQNQDAYIAIANMEYWNDHNDKALSYCDTGLNYHPESVDLLLIKAKALNSLNRNTEAYATIERIIKLDNKNSQARSLAERIKDKKSKNKVGINYEYVNFDKQFNVPWHFVSVDYSRQTSKGSITGRVNYANRFNESGVQFETDLYYRLSKRFYTYSNLGYSDNVGIFPKYRAGFSLFANLPQSFEAEAGFRYLYFSDPTWIYTASLGKYYKNYLFLIRTYLTPDHNKLSKSFSANVRYYYGGADDYISIGAGTGLSPDSRNDVLINKDYVLKSYSVSAGYRHAFNPFQIVSFNAGWQQNEYLPEVSGNQYNISIGFQQRF